MNTLTLDQAKKQIPSLHITAFSSRNTAINVRGIGSNSVVNGNGRDSSVGVNIDDVYYARQGQAVSDLVHIDRIEVLKGPQGTLFGRNITAGAIGPRTAIIRRQRFSETAGRRPNFFANASGVALWSRRAGR